MPGIQSDLFSTQEAGNVKFQDTCDVRYFGENKEYRAHRSGLIETRKQKNGQGRLLDEFRPVPITKYKTDKYGGYYWSASCRWGKKTNPRVHVVICSLFHEKTGGRNEVNHIDGNRDNNSADNLEWCTRAENARNAVERGAFKDINMGCGFMENDICRLLSIVTQMNAGITNAEMARRYDIDKSTFSNLRLIKTALAKKFFYLFNNANGQDWFGADLPLGLSSSRQVRKKPDK